MSGEGETMRKALAAWGSPLPDWVLALATACDEEGLRKVAGKVGVSPALASLAVNNKRANHEYIQTRVERTLMISMVPCPVLGVVTREECLREQTRPFTASNPLRVQIFSACRGGCNYFKQRKNKENSHVA